MAKECFVPLLMVRRHASTIVHTANMKIDQCYKDAKEENMAKQGDNDQLSLLQKNCLMQFQTTLRESVPVVNHMYDGYIKNYSKTDGKLIEKNFGKSTGKGEYETVKTLIEMVETNLKHGGLKNDIM